MKDVVLHLCMQVEPLLIVVEVVEHGREAVVVQSVGGQVFDDDALQLLELHGDAGVVLGDSVDVVFSAGLPVEQPLHVGEERALLERHVGDDAVHVVVVELEDELGQVVAQVEGRLKLLAYGGQLELHEILVARPQVVEQRGHIEVGDLALVEIPINGEVDHSQESGRVDMLLLADLTHRLVAEAQADTEGTEALQYIVVVADDGNQLVVRFIDF